MASDLLSIARSGARTARQALDVTAQNIANASTTGYVRRSVALAEVSASGSTLLDTEGVLAGVRLDRVVRGADAFRQAEVRRTGADAARAGAELSGLAASEAAIENSGLFSAIAGFEAGLQRLAADPVDPALRAAALADAHTMTTGFGLAAAELDATGETIRFAASAGVEQVNALASELVGINDRLARAHTRAADFNSLLDQRDALLEKISRQIGVSTTIAADHTVELRIGGAAGPQLVGTGTAFPLAMTTATDGTIAFTLDGNAVAPASGALAGHGQALGALAETRTALDAIAADLIAAANGAQAAGAALDGAPGSPLFTGTGAADIALAFTDGALLATAPAGAGAGSRDPAGLDALRAAISGADPAGRTDRLLFAVSSQVAGAALTREAIDTIAGAARGALQREAGVDLDQEAVNLVRFQQAFQASGKVMQVASDIFDTLLGIR